MTRLTAAAQPAGFAAGWVRWLALGLFAALAGIGLIARPSNAESLSRLPHTYSCSVASQRAWPIPSQPRGCCQCTCVAVATIVPHLIALG
jgi:hypothetical protein